MFGARARFAKYLDRRQQRTECEFKDAIITRELVSKVYYIFSVRADKPVRSKYNQGRIWNWDFPTTRKVKSRHRPRGSMFI